MKKILFLIPIIFFFLSFNRYHDQKKVSNEPFYFIQLADPQIGFTESKNFENEIRNFEKAITGVNRLKPAFMVIPGDLVSNCTNQNQIAEFQRIYKNLEQGIAGYLTTGNHDVRTIPSENTLTNYSKLFGKDWYSFEYNGWKFIVLNSSIIQHPDSVETGTNEQLDWLKKELRNTSATEPIIVFQHHLFFLKSIDESFRYENLPLESQKIYLELFEQYHVKAVFTGHLHRNHIIHYKDVELITTGAVSKSSSEEPTGVRIVKVYKDHFECTYYGLDSIPQTIILKKEN